MAESGIPYVLEGPGGTIHFNDWLTPDRRVHRADVYMLTEVGGLTPALRTSSSSRVGRPGVRRGQAAFEGLEPVLEGQFIHSGPEMQESMRRRLVRVAHSILNVSGVLRWLPSDINEWRQVTVQLLDRVSVTGGLFKEFQLMLEAERPFIVGESMNRAYTGFLGGSSGGGLTFPLTFPINFVDTAGAGVGVFHNAGENDSYPIIRIYGPITGPVSLRNNLTETLVSLPTLTLSAGQFAQLDMYEERITLNGDPFISLVGHLAPEVSEFFPLVPGDNPVQLIGSSGDPTQTRAEVEWRHSYG